jgi:hypothetical protein
MTTFWTAYIFEQNIRYYIISVHLQQESMKPRLFDHTCKKLELTLILTYWLYNSISPRVILNVIPDDGQQWDRNM